MSNLNIWREGEYQAFKLRLQIDRHRLDDEVIELPTLIMEVAEVTTLASARAERLANELKFARSQAAEALRQDGEKRTIAAMEQEVELDEDVKTALKTQEKARVSAQFWARLLDAFRVKQSSLKRLGEYMMAGYMGSASVSDIRKSQAEQRKAFRDRPRLKEAADD